MSKTNISLKSHLLKSDNEEYISPVTSTDTVYMGEQKLTDILNSLESGGGVDTSQIITKIDNIDNSIGEPTDVAGTQSTGTINGKLNKIIANTENINFEEGAEIKNILGTTSDSDATSSSGTVNGKLNKIITNTENINFEEGTEIKNILGNTSDSGATSSTGSISGKLNKLITLLNGFSNSDIDNIISLIGTSESSSTTSLFGLLNRGIIKSVQRGRSSIQTSGGSTPNYAEPVINKVDTTKSIVLLNGGGGSNGEHISPYLYSLSSTRIVIGVDNRSDFANISYGIVSWQVIEFY